MGRRRKVEGNPLKDNPQDHIFSKEISAKEFVEILKTIDLGPFGNKSDTNRFRFFLKQYNSSTIAAFEKKSIIEQIYFNDVPAIVTVSDKIACPRGVESSFLYERTMPIEDILSCLKFFYKDKSECFFVFNKKQFCDLEMFLFDNLMYNKREIVGDQIIVSKGIPK